MLDESGIRSRVAGPPCVDCGSAIRRIGTRGPPKKRCIECKRLVRKAARRIKDGVEVPLGALISCHECGAAVTRTAGSRRFCDSCATKSRRRKDMARYYQERGREPLPGVGSLGACIDCSVVFTKSRARHVLCANCRRSRANLYNRRKRAADRRAQGIPVRAGVMIECGRCSLKFPRRAVNQKYCKACHYEPIINYNRKRRKVDPVFALNHAMGAAIRKSLIRGTKRRQHWETLVGYTVAQLVRHIERQFLPDMTWKNRGAWHIEHIVPLKAFKFKTAHDPDFRAAWAITNLRPWWGPDNLLKGSQRTLLL